MNTTSTNERQAIRHDAQRRLAELRAMHEVLLPHVDDAVVLSEMTTIASQITSAEEALHEDGDR